MMAGFLDAGLLDEVLIYPASLMLGAGRSAMKGDGLQTVVDTPGLELVDARSVGPDLRLWFRGESGVASVEPALSSGVFP